MTKEEKIDILGDRFKKNKKDFFISHYDYHEIPFIVIRSGVFHTKDFVNEKQLKEWFNNPLKYQKWLIEIIGPYLEKWGECYIGFSNIIDYNNITIWVKRDGIWQTELNGKELDMQYIIKNKRVWF